MLNDLERILSRPVAKPYRSGGIKDVGPPHLNADGHLDFAPDDIESRYCFPTAEMWLMKLRRSQKLDQSPEVVYHSGVRFAGRQFHLRFQQPFWVSPEHIERPTCF